MNQQAFNLICRIFDEANIKFDMLNHLPCRTSAESAAARSAAGFPAAVGAKALVVKINYSNGQEEFGVLVLPGFARLNSRALKERIPLLKKFRFATADELLHLAGVVPGCMPPFGKSVFPNISKLYVDQSIARAETLGFNAAFLEKSIVVGSSDYLQVADFDEMFEFAD